MKFYSQMSGLITDPEDKQQSWRLAGATAQATEKYPEELQHLVNKTLW